MERKSIKSVSVEQNSHNCDIDKKTILGCYSGDVNHRSYRYCDDCKAGICPDVFLCALDYPYSDRHPLYWRPARSFEEALDIVNAHPISSDMTFEERLAAQKARFGL